MKTRHSPHEFEKTLSTKRKVNLWKLIDIDEQANCRALESIKIAQK